MSKKNIMEVVSTIVEELTPLTSEERQRAIQASLTLLGETQAKIGTNLQSAEGEASDAASILPARTRTWMKQNALSAEQLDQVFHFVGGDVEIIASEIPGRTNREKVRNAYVLLGVARFLASGEGKFDDKAARALCEVSGFYDQTNHMKYMKGGNEFTGSKEKGWSLTAPGLKHGAILISELSK